MRKAVALTILMTASSASAQTAIESNARMLDRFLGTTSTSFLPQFASGALRACLVEFKGMALDRTVQPNAYLAIDGSFGFMRAQQTVAPVLKVVVNTVDRATLSFTPSAPVGAYLSRGSTSTAASVLNRMASDTPGGLFSIFNLEASEAFIHALGDPKVRVLMSRAGRTMDVPFEIDMSVTQTSERGERVRGSTAGRDALDCLQTMIKEAR